MQDILQQWTEQAKAERFLREAEVIVAWVQKQM